ncbi:MAG: fumarylacetoacetate hydrolase family protein [Paludibacter sp.]|nr:fumarylacetoacetate hydrolase family protein [Bacteroidales bacterium]MCM1068844.1 fumarylacetoacetate hydrolase family protein [Prevotella sp.]MCM1353105.1 fumarylacetoacetate hydrolase family protein [Bacteroides sp.]MCM1442427.1 fumarylacetoacetate hydrolase family protein [Muribaculum sp.]MCM1481270.1 fumarylacetoacetate hydrolase family protein [Paludibacter sp.]
MKIAGLTYEDGLQMYLKPDSALLVGGKPFFLPPFSEQVGMRPCLVARICRLGRNIGQRFASRYYDAVALGMNMQALDLLSQAKEEGASWLSAVSFDNSLAVGEMLPTEQWKEDTRLEYVVNEKETLAFTPQDVICSLEDAICRLSAYITVRMGDMVVVDLQKEARLLQQNEDISGLVNGDEMLHCRIK